MKTNGISEHSSSSTNIQMTCAALASHARFGDASDFVYFIDEWNLLNIHWRLLIAHPQQQAFVAAIKAAFPSFFTESRVLEIGSLDINGSVRQYFSAGNYIGIDVGPGPGVDVVCQGQDYGAPDGSFDVVISCETMEHNLYWRETFVNMLRLSRPGGLIIMTCATTGRPEHGTRRTTPEDAPLIEWDYYKNLRADDFQRAIALSRNLEVWIFCSDFSFCDLFFAGFKAGGRIPLSAAAKLAAIRRNYFLKNLANRKALLKQVLIKIMGEQHYISGSLSPWKR